MALPEDTFAKRSYLELERTTDHGNFFWKVISSNRLCHAHKHNIIAWSRMSYSLRSLCSSSRPGGSSNLALTCSNNSELPPAAWIKNHRARQRKWPKTLHKNHGWQSQLKSKKKHHPHPQHPIKSSSPPQHVTRLVATDRALGKAAAVHLAICRAGDVLPMCKGRSTP